MTPDEVIAKLKSIGITISRPTLTRYEKQELISEPTRGALGRGGGRWTNYPDDTVAEAAAAWFLMHGKYGDEKIKAIFGGIVPILTPQTISYLRAIHFKSPKYYKYVETGEGWHIEILPATEEEEENNNISTPYGSRESQGMSFIMLAMGLSKLWESEFLRAKELLAVESE